MEEESHPRRSAAAVPDAGGGRSSPLLPRRLPSSSSAAGLPFLVGRRLMRPRLLAAGEEGRRRTGGEGGSSFSRSVVALDLVWNLAFVLATASVLLASSAERPATPLRVWVFVYAVQCLLHVGFVLFECRRRRHGRGRSTWALENGADEEEEDDDEGEAWGEGLEGRMVKRLESLNAMVSFLWWLLGFYWIVVGGQSLLQDAPRLYWLSVVFLAFDVFFAVFCIILACVISVAVCCCLPCILAFVYAAAGHEGASDTDLRALRSSRFCQIPPRQNIDLAAKDQAFTVTPSEPGNCSFVAPPLDDSECCICLVHYEDGVELNTLPCNHHFHSSCIMKWLRINATCPLCKYDIRRLQPADDGGSLV